MTPDRSDGRRKTDQEKWDLYRRNLSQNHFKTEAKNKRTSTLGRIC